MRSLTDPLLFAGIIIVVGFIGTRGSDVNQERDARFGDRVAQNIRRFFALE